MTAICLGAVSGQLCRCGGTRGRGRPLVGNMFILLFLNGFYRSLLAKNRRTPKSNEQKIRKTVSTPTPGEDRGWRHRRGRRALWSPILMDINEGTVLVENSDDLRWFHLGNGLWEFNEF